MDKKEVATTFLQLASSGDVMEAYQKFVHSDFIHHNPYYKGDRNSLLKGMEEAHKTNPNLFLRVQSVFENGGEDGALVAVHSHVRQKDNTDIAVVHIFRFLEGKIIELWDVGVLVPKDSPNENGVF